MGTKKDKKKKKFWPILLIAAFVISLVACSDDFWEEDYSDTESENSSGNGSVTSVDSSETSVRGLNINVNNSTGELRVTRSAIENTGDIGDAGVWTIFVYLCGTDLESDYGSATDDMEEMSASEALSALEAAVSYKISGSTHRSAYGLSIYYPLCVQGSEELSIWSGICVSPYYFSFVDRQNQCCASGSSSCYDTYDCNQWFDEYGEWSYGWLFEGESRG